MNGNMKIAIIGASVKFPFAESLRDLDRIYSQKIDCIHDITEKRIRLNGLEEGEEYTQFGYLDDLDFFDYEFFRMSKSEATCIDPQQRICLELACRAIESAGYSLSSMAGTDTAVFVGGGKSKYDSLFDDDTGFAATGNMADAMAGRISYMLDLRGEAAVSSTACSSSMYAAYDACVKLTAGACDAALVGGILLYFDILKKSEVTEDAGTIGLAAPDGRCKTFDDRADGINLCEGAGFIFLKRYEDAERDGDNILAVITAAGANQDGGRSNSFTAPSITAQTEIFRKVWDRYGIDPETIGYYEAHGTGTRIGDPIEIASITEACAAYTDRKQFCPVGSLKTNYAHPGSAAGVASIIKGVLSIRNGKKYPLRDLQKPNSMIDFENSPVYPISELEEWDDDHKVFAINGFGSTGTNVHIIMENDMAGERDRSPERDEHLITISTRDREQLAVYKKELLKDIDSCSLADICFTFNSGRDDYEYRDAARVTSKDDLRSFLERDSVSEAKETRLVILCSGDSDMEPEEIETMRERYPVFRKEYDRLLPHVKTLDGIMAAVDAACIRQLEAWGFTTKTMMGTGRGNASLAAASGRLAPEGLDRAAAEDTGFDEGRFTSYMKMMAEAEDIICVDVSPGGKMMKALERDGGPKVLRACSDGSLLDCAAELYLAGLVPDWDSFCGDSGGRKAFLASYPFRKTSAWPSEIKKYGQDTVREDDTSSDLRTFLRNTWKKTLDLEDLDDDEDVFELGANSLVSMSIINRIKKRTGVELDFEDIYEFTTVNALYDHLISLTGDEGDEIEEAPKGIMRKEGSDLLRVSGNQERMLIMIEDTVNRSAYNMPALYRIDGPLDEDKFAEAVRTIVSRHEILRTVYVKEEGTYYQKILEDFNLDIPVTDGPAMEEDEICAMADREAERVFDLFSEIPERSFMVRKSDDLHYWFINIHHIAADGWSLGLFYNELTEIYNALAEGRKADPGDLRIQYADFAEREHAYLESSDASDDVDYWKEQLSGVSGILRFPTDLERPQVQRYRGSSVSLKLGRELTDRIGSFCRKNGMSEFMLLESAYAILLHLYSGEDDICVGVPVAGRDDDDVKELIGFFANTIVVRSRFDREGSVMDFLKKGRRTVSDAFSHSRLPFEEVVKNIRFERSPQRAPLFQYAFTMQNFALHEMELDGIKIRMENPVTPAAKFDLTFTMFVTADGIEGIIEYDTDLFTERYVNNILEDYTAIVESAVEDPSGQIDGIELSSKRTVEVSDDPLDSLF